MSISLGARNCEEKVRGAPFAALAAGGFGRVVPSGSSFAERWGPMLSWYRVSYASMHALCALMVLALATSGCASPPHRACSANDASSSNQSCRLDLALKRIPTRPDQAAAVETIATEIEKLTAPVRAADAEVTRWLADSIAQNAFNTDRLELGVGKLVTVATAATPQLIAQLDRLHGALDAPQRAKLVAAVRDGGDEIGTCGLVEKMSDRVVRVDVHVDGGISLGVRPPLRMHQVATCIRELDLSYDQQREAQKTVLGELDATEKEMEAKTDRLNALNKALSDAFESDHFDAGSFQIAKDVSEIVKVQSTFNVRGSWLVSQPLTTEQRAVFAAYLGRLAEPIGDTAAGRPAPPN